MKKLFSPDSPITIFLTKLADLMIMNLLWLLGCVPVTTVGASTTALYRCVMLYRKDGDIPFVKEFWKAYRVNLKQSTILFLIMIAVGSLVAADLYVVVYSQTEVGIGGMIGFAALALFCLPAMGYVFPLQAQFENSVPQTLKNAWLMSILHFPKSLVVMILNLLPLLVLLLWTEVWYRSLLLWFFLGGAATAYLNGIVLQGIFRKYISQDKEPDSSATQ